MYDIITEPETPAVDWDKVKEEIENTAEGGKVEVDLTKDTIVKGEVIDSIKGKDIDLGITTNTVTIPVDVINTITAESCIMQISLDYDGEFGFKATLTINMDSVNFGYYANLFYYNTNNGGLEFMYAGLIDENGDVNLEFTHASDYAIVIADKILDGSTEEEPTTTPDTEE